LETPKVALNKSAEKSITSFLQEVLSARKVKLNQSEALLNIAGCLLILQFLQPLQASKLEKKGDFLYLYLN
jgi:hypothetical protein